MCSVTCRNVLGNRPSRPLYVCFSAYVRRQEQKRRGQQQQQQNHKISEVTTTYDFEKGRRKRARCRTGVRNCKTSEDVSSTGKRCWAECSTAVTHGAPGVCKLVPGGLFGASQGELRKITVNGLYLVDSILATSLAVTAAVDTFFTIARSINKLQCQQ